MLGKRSPQPTLFDVEALNTIRLQPGSFSVHLAEAGPGQYPDELFAMLYKQDRGWRSVPPSRLALQLLLAPRPMHTDREGPHTQAAPPRTVTPNGSERKRRPPRGRARKRRRVKLEHRQARLAQLGVNRARYLGRAKTECQGFLAATIVNLRTIWNRTGVGMRSSGL